MSEFRVEFLWLIPAKRAEILAKGITFFWINLNLRKKIFLFGKKILFYAQFSKIITLRLAQNSTFLPGVPTLRGDAGELFSDQSAVAAITCPDRRAPEP